MIVRLVLAVALALTLAVGVGPAPVAQAHVPRTYSGCGHEVHWHSWGVYETYYIGRDKRSRPTWVVWRKPWFGASHVVTKYRDPKGSRCGIKVITIIGG